MIDPNKKPVDAIQHPDETRKVIPTSECQGEEAMNIAGAPTESIYSVLNEGFDRSRDPELYWLGKYKDQADADSAEMTVDIRSLYVHEDIAPEMLIKRLYQVRQEQKNDDQLMLFSPEDMRTEVEDQLERVADYYTHSMGWKNRLIQGDSLLVMNSLLNREGMAGKVQTIYIDPPYGIKFGSNWQMKLNSRDVKDNDENVSGEPEMIKAFRDTWELGIHSYLTYLRDRLVLAKELLTQSGSVFVQISDENVHLIRNLLDEIFGCDNFVSQIIYTKTTGMATNTIGSVADYILWYAKDINAIKVRKLYKEKDYSLDGALYSRIELANGERMSIGEWEKRTNQMFSYNTRPQGSRIYRPDNLSSQGSANVSQDFEFEGKIYTPSKNSHWKANYPTGMERLKELRRIHPYST